jgi:rhodanese-related sulfurtransferase
MRLGRRTVLVGLTATAVGTGIGYALFSAGDAVAGATVMTPPEALAALQAGEVVLVDIRRPDEWAQTGLAPGAVPIDMRRRDFAEAVRAAVGSSGIPVALICARGVRSRRMTEQLLAAGITPIIDVPEGMLGSFAGPGWLRRGLPVVAWDS